MHVAINGWFWNQTSTGSGQYLRNLLHALDKLKRDLRITLIVPDHVRELNHLPDSVSVAYAPAFSGGHWGKLWFEQRSFPKAVAQVEADLAHVPYWGPPLQSPAPLIVSILDVIPLALPEYRGGLLAHAYISLVAAGARGADHILTLSEASKADIIERLLIPPEKITTTLLAADARFTPIPDAERDAAVKEKYNLPDEFALYMGGFDRRKNVNTLLLAWTYAGPSLGGEVPLILAGKMPGVWGKGIFPDLPQYARDLNLGERVIWLGEVAEEDKPSLYRLAKVFIWCSLYEGFGLPALEAMASGTPVVAGKISSTPEVVGDAAYLVDATNAREMGGAILALIVQDDFNQHMSNRARGQSSKFNWQKTALGTYEIYAKLSSTS